MNTTDEREKRGNALTRREFLTRPFAWIAREPASPGDGEAVPCRMALSALKHIPEAALLQMTPVLRQGWTARICEVGIAYRNDSRQEGIVSLGPEGCAATRLFNGVRTLEQVAAAMDAELGMAPGHSTAIVCEAFLKLAEREVYHPHSPPGSLHTPLQANSQYA